MAWRYKLSKLFPEGQTFRVTHRVGNINKSSTVRFESGKVYETEDEVLAKSLKGLFGRYPNTKQNTLWLQGLNVPYELVPCQSCGGKVLKLQVHYVEVEEV